jgi:hypothetical protein
MIKLLHCGKVDVQGFFKQWTRARSLKGENVKVQGFEFHLITDNVTLEAKQRLVPQVGVGIDEEAVPGPEYVPGGSAT